MPDQKDKNQADEDQNEEVKNISITVVEIYNYIQFLVFYKPVDPL